MQTRPVDLTKKQAINLYNRYVLACQIRDGRHTEPDWKEFQLTPVNTIIQVIQENLPRQ